MKIFTFILLNFIVGFISDIILNDLSKRISFLNTLIPYFENKSIILAGIYAGLTIVSAILVLLPLSNIIFNFYIPSNLKDLSKYLLLAYIIGFIFDYLIYVLKIFDNLEEYYKNAGAGHWGAIAFIFSISPIFFLSLFVNLRSEQYLKAHDRVIKRLIEFEPEFLLISMGFDMHKNDGLGQFRLDSKDFYEITKRTLAATDKFTRGKVVSVLEGGYDLNALTESANEHVNALIEFN